MRCYLCREPADCQTLRGLTPCCRLCARAQELSVVVLVAEDGDVEPLCEELTAADVEAEG